MITKNYKINIEKINYGKINNNINIDKIKIHKIYNNKMNNNKNDSHCRGKELSFWKKLSQNLNFSSAVF